MTINLPDGSKVSEIVLPDGSTASEVIAPDGSVVFSGAPAIPDSVVSRPDDDNFTGASSPFGLVINSDSDYGKIAARVSTNTTGFSQAKIYDFSTGAYELTIDISGKASNDAFVIDYPISANTDYAIDIANDGQSYTVGFASNETSYPYTDTSGDIDIVSRSEGNGETEVTISAIAVNDIGDPDNIL